MENEKEFHRILDKYVKEKIESIRKKDPRYFSKLVAGELLKYFSNCVPKSRIELIERIIDRDGNENAVHKLMDEIPRYFRFAFHLLKGLVENNQKNIAEEIMHGIAIDQLPPCPDTEFINSLLPRPSIASFSCTDTSQTSPPSYDEATGVPGMHPSILSDQVQKERMLRNSPLDESMSLTDPVMRHSYEPSVPESSPWSLNIPLPSTNTRDDNPSATSDIMRNDPSLAYSQATYPLQPKNTAVLEEIGDSITSKNSPTIRENTQIYAAGFSGNNGEDIDKNIQSRISSVSNMEDPTLKSLRLQSSELCISDTDSDFEGSSTKPKEVYSDEIRDPSNASDNAFSGLILQQSELCISESDEELSTRPKEVLTTPAGNLSASGNNTATKLTHSESQVSNDNGGMVSASKPEVFTDRSNSSKYPDDADSENNVSTHDNIERDYAQTVETENLTDDVQPSMTPIKSDEFSRYSSLSTQRDSHPSDSRYSGSSTAFTNSNVVTVREVQSVHTEMPETRSALTRKLTKKPDTPTTENASNNHFHWIIVVTLLAGIMIGRLSKR